MSGGGHGGNEPPKTQAFSRNGSNGSREVTVPLSVLVTVGMAVLGAGGGAGAFLHSHDGESVTEALTKVDRKVDMVLLRLDQFEPRLGAVESEARRDSDRLTRLEEREAASRPPR